jgi:CPA1 family monovalent cation:H+ antiporter
MYQENLSLEVSAVSLVVFILFLASLLALAPLRKLRLPFTVAVMLLGFVLGQLVGSGAQGTDEHGMAHEMSLILSGGGEIGPNLIFFVFLPALVFESAYNLEARQVLKNLLPISVLAVPVLLLSTVVTGSAVMLGGGASYGLTWQAALLFGAMVSATDPVAVVAVFKDLGAPKRLGILVEGESLFNDGTAIVLFNILLAIMISTEQTTISSHFLHGVVQFLVVAGGGLLVGTLLAWSTFALIGRIFSQRAVEISLSVVLAYASFIIAEHFLHVSGVMATVAAGLVAGSYGRTKLSHGVTEFMHGFWEYMAFVMNSLIFFLVGLVIAIQGEGRLFVHTAPLLGVALLAVIAARALGVFTTVPLLKSFVEVIDRRYQAVMFWGGLRGAVSLALALMVAIDERLPQEMRDTILIMAAGVVLFTLLVNALTMQPLISRLGLAVPSLLDRFAMAYAEVGRVNERAEALEHTEREGAALPAVLEALRKQQRERELKAHNELALVQQQVAGDVVTARAVGAMIALSVEKREIMRRFTGAELREPATKALMHATDLLVDRVKAGLELPEERRIDVSGLLSPTMLRRLEPLPLLGKVAQRLWADHLARDMAVSRGLFLASRTVERTLGKMIQEGGSEAANVGLLVQARYAHWKKKALERFHTLANEFPEYAVRSQRILAERHLLRVEVESMEHMQEAGLLTEKAVRSLEATLISREQELVAESAQSKIELDPFALIKRVPCFVQADEELLKKVASQLISRTVSEGEDVIVEGATGSSMYLIVRGSVLVTARDEQGRQVPLASLGPGDEFGELGALLGGARRATVRAMTPLNLLELTRSDLESVMDESPRLSEQVRKSIYPRVVGRALLHCDELAPLSPELRDELAQAFVLERWEAGEAVVQPGQPQRLTYLAEGTLRMGARILREGDLLVIGALLDAKAVQEVQAMVPVSLLVLPPEALAHFRAEYAEELAACIRLVGNGSASSV